MCSYFRLTQYSFMFKTHLLILWAVIVDEYLHTWRSGPSRNRWCASWRATLPRRWSAATAAPRSTPRPISCYRSRTPARSVQTNQTQRPITVQPIIVVQMVFGLTTPQRHAYTLGRVRTSKSPFLDSTSQIPVERQGLHFSPCRVFFAQFIRGIYFSFR